jgi:aminoglycoside phosphotransferase (APT) family kinase protein
MDRADGHPMSAAIDLARPAPVARALAELHASVHARRAPQLPSQHEELARRIDRAQGLTAAQKRHAQSRLDALPHGDALCHGDFHLDNIVLTAGGPVVIDWIDATRGDPLCDVARTVILIRHAHFHTTDAPRQEAVRAAAGRFAQIYLTHYADTTGADVEEAELWIQTNAAARMSEGIDVEQQALKALAGLPT